jgi:glyoxylase-like metal-dependent hydrolase (beta-lactamase superfamily II)
MRYLLLILVTVATCTVAKENSTTLQIKQIDNGVFLHTSYKMIGEYGLVDSNGLVVVNGHQAIIIDTPWSEDDTEKLLSWIRGKGLNVEASVSTHSHEDRTAGIQALNSESIPTYTSELTNEILVREGKPTATNVFDNSEFSLFDGLVEVFYPGAGHTEDNLVVWLPENSILFGGCLVRSLEWEGLGFTGDASVNSWADSIRKIQSKYTKIETIVPGHGKVGDSSILGHTIKLAEKASDKSIQPTAKAATD